MDKRTNNDIQNITQKTTDRATRTILKTGGELRCSVRESSSFMLHMCHPSPYTCYKSRYSSWMRKGPDCEHCDKWNIQIVLTCNELVKLLTWVIYLPVVLRTSCVFDSGVKICHNFMQLSTTHQKGRPIVVREESNTIDWLIVKRPIVVWEESHTIDWLICKHQSINRIWFIQLNYRMVFLRCCTQLDTTMTYFYTPEFFPASWHLHTIKKVNKSCDVCKYVWLTHACACSDVRSTHFSVYFFD